MERLVDNGSLEKVLEMKTRIINGTVAKPNSHSYIASLQMEWGFCYERAKSMKDKFDCCFDREEMRWDDEGRCKGAKIEI